MKATKLLQEALIAEQQLPLLNKMIPGCPSSPTARSNLKLVQIELYTSILVFSSLLGIWPTSHEELSNKI